MLHPYFGVAFVFFFGLQAINWWGPMKWTDADSRWIKHLPEFLRNAGAGRSRKKWACTTAGRKLQFWEIVVGCIVYLITGIVMWAGAPTFGAMAVAVSYVLHDISALIMLFGIFFHLYQTTFGQPGTIQAMTTRDGQRSLGLDACSRLVSPDDRPRPSAGPGAGTQTPRRPRARHRATLARRLRRPARRWEGKSKRGQKSYVSVGSDKREVVRLFISAYHFRLATVLLPAGA